MAPRVMSALVSVSSLAVGGMCLALTEWLPSFAPCRVFYRTHNAVQDTFQCQAFMVLGVTGLALLLVGLVAGAIAGYFAVREYWRPHHP
jgi:hypothetical protein